MLRFEKYFDIGGVPQVTEFENELAIVPGENFHEQVCSLFHVE